MPQPLKDKPHLINNRWSKSQLLLERALQTIPLGTQTFSKSYLQMPKEHGPLFMERGKGAHVYDVDGNEYVDCMMALAPVVLGYCDPDVDAAIKAQLDKGICLSMPTTLEMECAERIVNLIPCADMVRFGKNGSDATTAAVRLARAYTKRDKVIVCGYHGWHDWFIGSTTRKLGVPKAVCDLTISVAYNDIDAMKRAFELLGSDIAAVTMEPMNAVKPLPGYLEEVREITKKYGALLIFDEVVTGFRYDIGGAQTRFGITPDLAAFGKAMANGMPLSAITGRGDIMKVMEDIFFSGTFGGEALSLAASIATIDKMKREPVIDHLKSMGLALQTELLQLISKHGLQDVFNIVGQDCLGYLAAKDFEGTRGLAIRTMLLQKMIEHGVLTIGAMTISYAFGEAEKKKVLDAADKAFSYIKDMLNLGDVEKRMDVPVIEPIFSVRKI